MSDTDNDYLRDKLKEVRVETDSPEAEALRDRRAEVEETIRNEYGTKPTVKYGGSHAKNTMVLASYDLDVLCYFQNDDDGAGDTLEDIYNNVADTLAKDYTVEKKRSALVLKSKNGKDDFHVDVVPGRFVNDEKNDVFLHQNEGDKTRLKTNPDVHIEHVRGSGQTDIICLLKAWRHRLNLEVKTFVFELAIVDALSNCKKKSLADRITHVFERFRDDVDGLTVVDPANGGNDLSSIWTEDVRSSLSVKAKHALAAIADGGWETVFGPLDVDEDDRAVAVQAAAVHVSSRTKPWLNEL